MDWCLSIFTYVIAVSIQSHGFNIETERSRALNVSAEWFGHRVMQHSSGIIVSAPLDKSSNLFKCSYTSGSCSPININGITRTDDWGMGLSLAVNPITNQLLACAPHLAHPCGKNMYLNSVCYKFDGIFLTPVPQNITPGYQECTSKGIDIAFLIDGSRSVADQDFQKMKDFMLRIIESFKNKNTNFAVVQFSYWNQLEFDFNRFLSMSDVASSIKNIRQLGSGTQTAAGIKYVADNVFVDTAGARSDAVRVLITITDGQSNAGPSSFPYAITAANKKNIIRYAIGVGNAFLYSSARDELNTIASSLDLVFTVDNFNALNGIQNQLEEKIFAIEGTQKDASVSAFQQEMSQGGFSTLFNANGGAVFGAVGAFDWSGGFFEESGTALKFVNMSAPNRDMKDSYMGYTVETFVASSSSSSRYYIVGAPRYRHKGRVIVFVQGSSNPTQMIEGTQVGSYFGSVLCSVDFNRDGSRDVLLIGSPMHHRPRHGGLITMYTLDSKQRFVPAGELTGIDGQPHSRFGASISEVADLNGDGFRDLAVGAPLENNNQGSVYIYNGGSGLPETFSQRIEASQVSSGLQYFGHSLHGVMDMSGDKLPDLAVGSLGRILVLRARPVIEVQTSMNFTPNIIKTDNSNCSDNRAFDLTVCFTLTDTTRDNLGTKSASITYNLVLDSVRTQFRAFFTAKERNLTGSVNITGPSRCMKHSMFIPECPEDSLNSIGNEVNFQFTGLPVSSAIGLKPILDPRSPTRLFFPLNFERNCGTDNKCTDHLKLSFNFSGARELQVGISPVLNLTVSIENAQEDSYNTAVTFTYPSGLSYRRVTLLQSDRRMTVRCEATPSDEGDATRMSSCSINRPIFKQGAQGVFVATFDVDTNSQLNRTMTISAEATSENTDSITNNSKYAKQIAVKFAINIQVRKVEESTNYVNFSVGRNDLKRFVKHCYEVENFGLREIPVTVTISIPVELGGKPVWSDRNTLQIPNCIASEEGPNPTVDFVEKLKKDQSLDCSVARCRVFTCQITKLETKKKVTFNVSGEVKSDWIEQTQQRTVILLSSASLRYDQNQFIHIFTQSEKSYTQTKALTRIELYEEYNYLPVVIGSSVGGLVLLALITAGLYKAGFFKRQYKEMMNEAAGDAGVPGQEGSLPTAPPPE